MKHKINRIVEVSVEELVYLGKVSYGEFYTQPSAFKKAWEPGYRALSEMFGGDGVKEYVAMPHITCPHLSYGHLGCIGAQIRYPDDSEPNMARMVDSVEDGIKWLERSWDFAKSDMFRFYESYYQKLREDYPGRNIGFSGLGKQGPITSAVLMRGQDFYIDMYEKPEESKKFLRLLTDSIIDFDKFIRKVNNIAATDDAGIGLTDDFAGFVAPDMYGEFVIPYWNQYYEAMTVTGFRYMHCEGMSRAHLPYLAKSKIGYFQPSVSPLLTCRMLAEDLKDLNIQYDWMLATFDLIAMDDAQIRQWAFDTTVTGVSLIRTQTDRYLFEYHGPEKIYIWLNAFEKLEQSET